MSFKEENKNKAKNIFICKKAIKTKEKYIKNAIKMFFF